VEEDLFDIVGTQRNFHGWDLRVSPAAKDYIGRDNPNLDAIISFVARNVVDNLAPSAAVYFTIGLMSAAT
jgi:hypothetical protein